MFNYMQWFAQLKCTFLFYSGCNKYKVACNTLNVYDEFTLGAFVGINKCHVYVQCRTPTT